jgi:hypothetical protein
MFTPFRDGLQSTFGGKVRLEDFLPAMKASAEIGVRHFEFGGGALFQAPLFYLGQNPFENMRRMREAVGPDADLQILTRSVSGVTLTTQSPDALALQARLMAAAGTTWDRNFDYMNDVRNLVKTGKPIVDAGMHHQVVIALMGLPFESDTVHTPEFYIDIGRQILDSGMHIDSICLKDASGTTDPMTIYQTAVGLKKIMPPELPLWMHTHDTASTGVACYMAAIHGGADGVDLAVRPLASGDVAADARSLAHALKGTGYDLDMDVDRLARHRVHAGGAARGLRLQPHHHHARRPRPGLPHARRRHRAQRPHDGQGRDPGPLRRGAGRVPGGGGSRRRVDQRDAGKPAVLAAGLQQRHVRPLGEDRGGLRQGRARLLRPTPLSPGPEGGGAGGQQLDLPPFDGDPWTPRPTTSRPRARRWRSATSR